MNSATITRPHLLVHHAQGHNDRKFPSSGISHTPNGVAGIGVPKTSGIMGRDNCGFFMPKVCLWRAGDGSRKARRCSYRYANLNRTATPLAWGGGIQPDYEQTIMSTSPTLGDLPENRLVSRATLEKRVRREQAKQGRKLLKSRPGTPAYRENGQYAIENDRRTVLENHLDLVPLARDLGVMQAHEHLDPHSDWRYYVVRQTTKIIDGKTIMFHDRLSRNFMTRAEAERHADRLKDEHGPVGIVGFDVMGDHRHE